MDVADDLINEFNLGIERASASELITIEGSVRAYPDTVLVKVTSPFTPFTRVPFVDKFTSVVGSRLVKLAERWNFGCMKVLCTP